jgi:hypothetical protein
MAGAAFQVDTPGLLLSVYVTSADLHDSKGAQCLLAGLAPLVSRLKKIWADAAYRGQELAQCQVPREQENQAYARRHACTSAMACSVSLQ